MASHVPDGADSPSVAQYLPGGQMVATELPAGQYVDALQMNWSGTDEPATHTKPGEHAPVGALNAVSLQYRPGVQIVGVDRPAAQ